MKVIENRLEVENIIARDEDVFYRIHIKCSAIDMGGVSIREAKIFTYCAIEDTKITNLPTNNLDDYFYGCTFSNCEFDDCLNRECSKNDNIILVQSLGN